jgi:hypothetical protein
MFWRAYLYIILIKIALSNHNVSRILPVFFFKMAVYVLSYYCICVIILYRKAGTMSILKRFSILFLVGIWLSISMDNCQMNITNAQDYQSLVPYSGVHKPGVDTSSLIGKIMCGYQGWFTCPGDGSGRSWYHYAESKEGNFSEFSPGHCSIDLWPDTSELDEDEKFATTFKHKDGSTAYVYSPMLPKTVTRHFKWMADYGIDGVFVQRFASETLTPLGLKHCNAVLDNCRAGANQHGRAYAVMYDLSGLEQGGTQQVIEDWKALVDHMKISRDPKDKAYLHHKGKPVISIWGIGFSDNRTYTLQECYDLIDFLKNDPNNGNLTVMVGIPTYWRTLERDAVSDPFLHKIVEMADIVSPWTVGRFNSPSAIKDFAQRVWTPDQQWCEQRGLDYLPVVWPGFSWANLRNDPRKFDQIPRLKGRFLWEQYYHACQSGATMIYQAMFDEVDEATAIFKCTSNPPVGLSTFLDLEGLPSDHYLWLVGQAGKMLRKESPAVLKMPKR